jgi:hypothetical protein
MRGGGRAFSGMLLPAVGRMSVCRMSTDAATQPAVDRRVADECRVPLSAVKAGIFL